MSGELTEVTSTLSVALAVDALRASLARRGITVFAVIDHAAGARESELALADEAVVIFGNPQAGTGLMQDDARVGIDLPLRILIWDDRGTTRVGFRDPQSLSDRFEISAHAGALAAMASLLAQLLAELE